MKINDRVESHHSFMYLWVVGALLVLGGLVYSYIGAHPEGVIEGVGEAEVRTVVGAFGNQLNSVSLLSPTAAEEIQSAYGPYVATGLLSGWVADPLTAPGRMTSSPWPDHIEADSVIANGSDGYDVTGRIMLVTSAGDAGIIPVSLTVSEVDGALLITRYEQGSHIGEGAEPSEAIVTVAFGETAGALGIFITPTSLEEDSRCPSDVQCIQAGTLRIEATVRDGMGTSTMPFTLAGPSVTAEAASIALIEAAPYPLSTEDTKDADYRFTFRIETR